MKEVFPDQLILNKMTFEWLNWPDCKKKLILESSCSKTKVWGPISPFVRKTIYKKQNKKNLYCAVTEPFEIKYHDHISDDTIHNGVSVDHVLRELIVNYNISNRSCENRLITPHTRINILLDDFNHWLMILTWGSSVYMRLRGMAI